MLGQCCPMMFSGVSKPGVLGGLGEMMYNPAQGMGYTANQFGDRTASLGYTANQFGDRTASLGELISHPASQGQVQYVDNLGELISHPASQGQVDINGLGEMMYNPAQGLGEMMYNPAQGLGGLAGDFQSNAMFLIRLVSGGASFWHGLKRNDSLGWALGWGFLGSLFPVITPAYGYYQGYAKPAAPRYRRRKNPCGSKKRRRSRRRNPGLIDSYKKNSLTEDFGFGKYRRRRRRRRNPGLIDSYKRNSLMDSYKRNSLMDDF